MKTMQRVLAGVFVCLSLISSAQTTKDVKIKLIDRILGTWKMQKVFDGKKESNSSDSLMSSEFQFNPEGHYKNVVGRQTVDSGSYRINETAGLLYLENKKSVLPGTNSQQATWRITFANNTMTMQGQGNAHAKRYRYVFIKTKDGSNSAPN